MVLSNAYPLAGTLAWPGTMKPVAPFFSTLLIEAARFWNLPPRKFLIPLLPLEEAEPRDIPAMELFLLR